MQRCTGSALSPPAPVGPWLPGCDADDAAAAAPNCCRHHRHDDPRTAMLQMPALKLGLPQPPQPFFNKSCAALLFPAPSLQPHVMTVPWPRMVAKAQSEAWIHTTVLRYGPAQQCTLMAGDTSSVTWTWTPGSRTAWGWQPQRFGLATCWQIPHWALLRA